MASLVPEILHSYLLLFRPHFNKPSFVYFSGYIVSLLLTGGRKTMKRVAHTCFFVDRHLASWERFLAENSWDPAALMQTWLATLHTKLGASLQIHGAYLAVVDTLLIAKNGQRMLGIQAWHDRSGNADRGNACGASPGHHDWHGFLWLDFDLSGLPCGQQADGSQKGFFSGKKTVPVGN